MTRDFLKGLELSEEVINQIMAEHGKTLTKAKDETAKVSAELEQTKSELVKANETLEKVKDYDNVKSEYETYKADAEKSKADYEKKISTMELQAKVKEFTGTKRFVNDFTKDAINSRLEQALNDEANKGKSLEELFNGITDGMENVFFEDNKPTPPVQNLMQDNTEKESGILSAFKQLNPSIKF